MKPRERILPTIKLREPDRILLFDPAVSQVVVEKLTGIKVRASILTETTTETVPQEEFDQVIKVHVKLGLEVSMSIPLEA